MSKSSVTLIIPGLFADVSSLAGIEPVAQYLAKLLRYADRQPQVTTSLTERTFELFAVTQENVEWPIAQIYYNSDFGHLSRKQCWCLAPVHLKPDFRQTVLFDAAYLTIKDKEADELVCSLNEIVSSRGFTIEFSSNNDWYLLSDEALDLQTQTLESVVGCDANQYLPTGRDAVKWQSVLTEIQMLLHMHPVNQLRSEAGQAEINSLWLYGGGTSSQNPISIYDAVYTDNKLARGLAEYTQTDVSELPECFEQQHLNAQQSLFIMTALQITQGVDAWQQQLEILDGVWFKSLWQMYQQGRLDQIILEACDGFQYIIKPGQKWRFWRKQKTFMEYANS